VVVTILLSPMAANADLIMNISDLGGGQTRWTFSGDAIALGDGTDDLYSFWGQHWNGGTGEPIAWAVNQFGTIISGSGEHCTTKVGCKGFDDAIAIGENGGGNDAIGPRSLGLGSGLNWSAGDTLSWAGDIVVTGINWSSLNPGTYTTSSTLATELS
jgi:hypothetical protein